MDDATNTKKGFLVKRADGTTARLSLDEIKRRAARKEKERDDASEEENTISDDVQDVEMVEINEEAVPEIPVEIPVEVLVEMPKELPPPQIIRERLEQKEKKEELPKNTWSKDDHASPLEEDMAAHEIIDADVQVYDYERIVDEIMQDIPMSIAPALQMRTRKMFLSLVRGTRDRHSFHELAVKKSEDGGLGLSSEDAARLVVVAMDKKHGHDKKIKHTFKPAKLPKVATPVYGALATTTPVRDYFKDVAQSKQQPAAMRNEAPRVVVPAANTERPVAPSIVASHVVPPSIIPPLTVPVPRMTQAAPRSPSKAIEKQLIHDLRAPEMVHRTVGPLEEMERFQLVDLRRLSNDPARAAEKIIEKLIGWKQESYLLYIDARNAWYRSPLYKKYQSTIKEVIAADESIEDFLRSRPPKDELSVAEIRAMVEINRQLTV